MRCAIGVRAGDTDVARIERDAERALASERLEGRLRFGASSPRSEAARTPSEVAAGEPLVVLAAAKLGTTRLIDNLEI